MGIAVTYSFYCSDQSIGVNAIVDLQVPALSGLGHEVRLFSRRTDELAGGRLYAAGCLTRIASGLGGGPVEAFARFRPAVVHVHNLFPNYPDFWLALLSAPIVAALHNFRPLCCRHALPRRTPVRGLPRRPPAKRRAARLLPRVTRGVRSGRPGGQAGSVPGGLLGLARRVVVLTERVRGLYLRAGLPPNKIVLLPNPHQGIDAPPESGDRRWVFVGRLSPEKDVLELLRSWPRGLQLDVFGAGPLEPEVRRLAGGDVRYLGAVPQGEMPRRLRPYAGLVLPSRSPEGGVALSAVEAWCAGVPVLALRDTSVADAIDRHRLGAVVNDLTPGTLALAARSIVEQGQQLRRHCAGVARQEYGVDRWTDGLLRLYDEARA